MKQIVKEVTYCKHFDGDKANVRFSDIPKNIEENDIIEINREESYFSENNSWDAFTELIISREREENEEEYQKRLEKNKKWNEEKQKKKYEQYLALKLEFEPIKP